LSDAVENAVLETLFLPFRLNLLPWAGRVAFLRARYGAPVTEVEPDTLECEQTFKPEADALTRAGFNVAPDIMSTGETFPLVLVLPPRQRDEARALLTRAITAAGDTGRVVVAAGNNTGARSLEADLARLAGPLESQSKNKCRVFWTRPIANATLDATLIGQWRLLDTPRKILNDRFLSQPGLFAWDRIDPASELLAAELPADLAGRAADLGASFGYLSSALLDRCPGVSSLDLYEAEARALELARFNVAPRVRSQSLNFHWHDVTAGLLNSYDVIVTNPPFHTGSGAEDPGLGRRFIAAAARALNPGGRLWVVANRHLPYENVLNASFGSMRIVTQRYGFKIIEARRSAARVAR
jgi:16S rRNA (guanine1207-N2)-methyltransferase